MLLGRLSRITTSISRSRSPVLGTAQLGMAPRKRAGTAAVPPPPPAKKPKSTAASAAPASAQPPGRSYFLMKSEAEVFSIDDLAQREHQTEPWDGVRNHQAKKVMQAMKTGDQALFWASNTKAPGVVGIVEIVREAYPDPTQFDPGSEYHDARSPPDAPRWCCVDVRLVRKLARPVTLGTLRQHAEGALSGMALFRQSRLSVQPVEAAEWEFVLGLEEEEEEEEAAAAVGDEPAAAKAGAAAKPARRRGKA